MGAVGCVVDGGGGVGDVGGVGDGGGGVDVVVLEGALAQAAADDASSAARAEGGGDAPTPDEPGGGAQSATSRSSATHHHQNTAASARATRPTRPGVLSRPKYAQRRLVHRELALSPGYSCGVRPQAAGELTRMRARVHTATGALFPRAYDRTRTLFRERRSAPLPPPARSMLPILREVAGGR